VTAAIFGLIGVVVGALLTAAREYLMARRQERAAARANARLLKVDLQRALDAIEHCLLPGRPPKAGPWDQELGADGWSDRLNLLATTMRDDDWEPVATAFVLVEKVRHGIASRWVADMRRERAVRAELAQASTQIEAALRALTHPARATPARPHTRARGDQGGASPGARAADAEATASREAS
jgi:hypothetical protein